MNVERNVNGAWAISSLVRHAPNATNTTDSTGAWFYTCSYYGYTRRGAIQSHKANLANSQLIEVDE